MSDGESTPSHTATAPLAAGLFAVGLGALVPPLDAAVNVAFPAITQAFAIPASDIQWIITIYVLSQSSLTIIFGKLGDRFGHLGVFMWGLALCAIALTLCGLAAGYPALVSLRLAQGVGAGLIMACGPALATFLLPPERKRQALALYTMLFGAGMFIGPLIGGLLIPIIGWPVVFWMRVPLAVLALLLLWRLPGVRSAVKHHAAHTGARKPFDLAGAIALALSLAALVFIVVQIRAPAFGSISLFAAAAVCLVSGFVLARQSRRAADPVIDLTFFAIPRFRALQLASVATHLTTFSLFLMLPYTLGAWPGLNLAQAGLVLAFFPGGTVLAGLLISRVPLRLSSNGLVIGGMLIAGLGLMVCASFSGHVMLTGTASGMLITGVGVGVFQVGHLDATMSAMPVAQRGVAGSIVAVSRLLGIVLSANGLFWLHDALTRANFGSAADAATAANDYSRTIFIAGAALMVGSLLYALRFGRQSATRPA